MCEKIDSFSNYCSFAKINIPYDEFIVKRRVKWSSLKPTMAYARYLLQCAYELYKYDFNSGKKGVQVGSFIGGDYYGERNSICRGAANDARKRE